MTSDGPRNASQSGLPKDAGNDMAERSGYADDSESGMNDTPVANGDLGGAAGTGVPDPPGQSSDGPSAGTTFGTGGDDERM
ncbi:hypothetical protein [Deinococcus hopiensis]|uniref:Uncharacterized protein n=1 Tax=Deinococcus hopiensis KR-140 TaxID=695939 RepID=A0A1W1VRD5_9DEIO|nr:hypothetical protein [Deinococcus hopiensis]SMB95919.1 hypothetical protein SAMN00790413_03072 [Deinococcus hopiensis KR-140]